METSIADIHKAMLAGTLTCHNLVQHILIASTLTISKALRSIPCCTSTRASLKQADAFDQDFSAPAIKAARLHPHRSER